MFVLRRGKGDYSYMFRTPSSFDSNALTYVPMPGEESRQSQQTKFGRVVFNCRRALDELLMQYFGCTTDKYVKDWLTRAQFIILTESKEIFDQVFALTADWPKIYRSKVTLQYLPVWYPANHTDMLNNFRRCSTQRIFIPSILPDEDALIYLDTDILFMTPPEDVWTQFEEFNSKQMIGIAPIFSLHPEIKVPYFNLTGKNGLNPVVMLMNLTRLKSFPGDGWVGENVKIYYKYKHQLVYGDQDVINQLFIKFPDLLFESNCEWDYQIDYCHEGIRYCPEALKNGARVVHGNAGTFILDHAGKMKALFESWKDFKLGTPLMDLFQTILAKLYYVSLANKANVCRKVDEVDLVLSQRLLHHITKHQ